MRDFLEVVYEAVEQPLRIDLVFAAVGEPVHALGRSDIRKDWFDDGQPSGVDGSAFR